MKALPNSRIYQLDAMLRQIVLQLMIEMREGEPELCEMCDVELHGKYEIHHTKYLGATIYDLMFICRRCQMQPENKGLA